MQTCRVCVSLCVFPHVYTKNVYLCVTLYVCVFTLSCAWTQNVQADVVGRFADVKPIIRTLGKKAHKMMQCN